LIHWEDLEKVSSDHLGYHVQATSGRFKIRKATMPENLLKRIKENIRLNQERKRQPTQHTHNRRHTLHIKLTRPLIIGLLRV
jgi:hypothetical protein